MNSSRTRRSPRLRHGDHLAPVIDLTTERLIRNFTRFMLAEWADPVKHDVAMDLEREFGADPMRSSLFQDLDVALTYANWPGATTAEYITYMAEARVAAQKIIKKTSKKRASR